MDSKVLKTILDEKARSLVGKLCKRAELLDASKALNPTVYKNLAKELIYEQFRSIKKYIDLYERASVSFKSKEKNNEE